MTALGDWPIASAVIANRRVARMHAPMTGFAKQTFACAKNRVDCSQSTGSCQETRAKTRIQSFRIIFFGGHFGVLLGGGIVWCDEASRGHAPDETAGVVIEGRWPHANVPAGARKSRSKIEISRPNRLRYKTPRQRRRDVNGCLCLFGSPGWQLAFNAPLGHDLVAGVRLLYPDTAGELP